MNRQKAGRPSDQQPPRKARGAADGKAAAASRRDGLAQREAPRGRAKPAAPAGKKAPLKGGARASKKRGAEMPFEMDHRAVGAPWAREYEDEVFAARPGPYYDEYDDYGEPPRKASARSLTTTTTASRRARRPARRLITPTTASRRARRPAPLPRAKGRGEALAAQSSAQEEEGGLCRGTSAYRRRGLPGDFAGPCRAADVRVWLGARQRRRHGRHAGGGAGGPRPEGRLLPLRARPRRHRADQIPRRGDRAPGDRAAGRASK